MLSVPYNPYVHTYFDSEKRRLYTDPVDGIEYLSGFMFWEINKVRNNSLPPFPKSTSTKIFFLFFFQQGGLVDPDTEINSPFVCSFVGRLPRSRHHMLYSCSMDDAPETIENERRCTPCYI
jgi:hypothetical protein